MNAITLDQPCTQAAFAELVGASQPTVHRMVRDGILPRHGTLREWIRAYAAALEAEKEALSGANDDTAEAREARLALTKATTRLRQTQERIIAREYKRATEQFIARVLGEVRALLYQQIPTAVVGRLLSVIPEQEQRYAAADAFRETIADAVKNVLDRGFDDGGLVIADETHAAEEVH